MSETGKIKHWMRERLWWLDVVYPIALATFLFGSLTYIVYSGQPQWRLALQGEKKLLEFSLRHAGERPLREIGTVLAVTAEPTDVARLDQAPLGNLPDASAASYAKVVTKLVEARVPSVFLHWDPGAHPTDEVYYLPLIEAFRRAKGVTTIYFAAPAEAAGHLPEELLKLVTFTDDGICDDADAVQTECSYLPDEGAWVMQAIVNETVGRAAPEAPLPAWASMQLASIFPQYILNLSPPAAISRVSFRNILHQPEATRFSGYRIAFVGADQSHWISGTHSSAVPHQVLTVFDRAQGGKVEAIGTSLPIFWAAVAQMFRDKAMVVVPSQAVTVAMTIAFCAVVGVVMSVFGGIAALGLFLVYVLSGPCINAAALRHFQVYLPLFNSYYFGLSTIIVVGLGRLSITAYRRWRLDAQRRLHAHIADLKGNFVSLLSHNLNTPVAKMQGMLALLTSQRPDSPWLAQASEAEALVTQLEYSIRSVLVASALEEGALSETSRTAGALLDEFLHTSSASLRKLGVRLNAAPLTAEEEEQLFLPVTFDVRALTTALSALAALFYSPGRTVQLNIAFHLAGSGDRPRLVVTLQAPGAWIGPLAEDILLAPATSPVRALRTEAFFVEILAGLAGLAVRTYRGMITVSSGEAAKSLVATFVPSDGTSVAL